MNIGLSDKIRTLAQTRYVDAAVKARKDHFSIRVKDLLVDLQAEGFPGSHIPQICSALKTSKFLRENGLELEGIDGPPSLQSTTVIFRYRIAKDLKGHEVIEQRGESRKSLRDEEDPAARAVRLSEKLRGILKDELAEYGGGEAFLRWIRSEDEDAA
ncbi:MAG: hypothetical protein WA354_12885 [Terracidiphilus sp.]